MPVLTLNYGVSPITVDCQKGGHAAPRRVGGITEAFGGAETSDIRTELMVVPVILAPKSPSQAAAIRALFALGAQVPCRGDVFNVGAVTVVCSGKISDTLDETAAWWTLNLTLYEVGTALEYVPRETIIHLTARVDGTDPGDGSVNQALLVAGASATFTEMLTFDDGETIPTCSVAPGVTQCAILSSLVPERSWLSEPFHACHVGGRFVLRFGSYAPTADHYPVNHTQARIYQVRGGVNIAGPFTTGYGAGFFVWVDVTVQTEAVILTLEDGDRFLIEFWSQVALAPGYADDGDRQKITYGEIADPLLTVPAILIGY